jgi:hypothetical protein
VPPSSNSAPLGGVNPLNHLRDSGKDLDGMPADPRHRRRPQPTIPTATGPTQR